MTCNNQTPLSYKIVIAFDVAIYLHDELTDGDVIYFKSRLTSLRRN